jgi:hypothetical protein
MYSSKEGEDNEIKYKNNIEKIVNCKLKLTHKFHTFDYKNKNDKILVELKCRNCFKNSYPTTMIGMNKINKSKLKLKKGYKIFYFFHFKDGLYYIEYNDELKYEIKDGFRHDRIKTIINKPQYAYINVDDLYKC